MVRIQKADHLYELSFMPSFFPVNCFLVEEKTSLTLVDAAMPFSVNGIMKMVHHLKKPIKQIVLTHAHEDHIGAVDKLKSILPDVPVYLSERDAKLLDGDLSVNADEPQTPIKGGVPKKMKTRPDIWLKEGDRIGSLEAIFTPGHTPGSMSFLDRRNGNVIVGDAFQTKGGMAVSGTIKIRFPFPALATWDKQTALQSAKKLHALNPSLLAVGHGSMVQQPLALMQIAISKAEQKGK